MLWSQLEYFCLDRRDAPLRPIESIQYQQPFFGGRTLSTVIMRDDDENEIVVSERNKFATILRDETQFKGSKAFLPGICLQMFGVSAEQWEDIQGHFRRIVFSASHQTMPDHLRPGQRLTQLGPRTPDARSALKGFVIPHLISTFPILAPGNSMEQSSFNAWCDRLWEVMFATESKVLNDRNREIKSHVFARVDQIFKIGWAHSDIGSTSIRRVKNKDGAITGFEKANVKETICMPAHLPRPPLEELSIRIVIDLCTDELVPVRGALRQQDAPLTRLPLPRSLQISFTELSQLYFSDVKDGDMLGALCRALEIELDIDIWHDRLCIAWRNPRTFWGERDVLVRIRTSQELSAVLEELRLHHLIQKGDRMLFLHLVSIDNVELKNPTQHPPWPEEYEITIAPLMQAKESPKRKLESDGEGGNEDGSPARKRRGRSGGRSG